MAYPTLTQGTVVITLPYPDANNAPKQPNGRGGSTWRAIKGDFHRQTTWRADEFQMHFLRKPRTLYDSLVAMMDATAVTGVRPLFTWPEGFPRAVGLEVDLDVGGVELHIDPTLVTFDVKLTESNGRVLT